jgi:hypothetical protein
LHGNLSARTVNSLVGLSEGQKIATWKARTWR